MDTSSLSPDLLTPLIGIPTTLCVVGFIVLFIVYKFTRFVFNMMMFITISIVLLLTSAGAGLYLYFNPDALKAVTVKNITKVLNGFMPKQETK